MEVEITRLMYEAQEPYIYKGNPKDNLKRVLKDSIVVEEDAKYFGFWNEKTNKRDGIGVMIWPDGSRYDGQWKNDLPNGYGRLIHADGDIYIGHWVANNL